MNRLTATRTASGVCAIALTCGDPDRATTLAAARAAVQGGADLILLSIPFSDPTAEGPVQQRASLRALRGGMHTDTALSLAQELADTVATPVVLVTYANVVLSYGADRFLTACEAGGIAGLLLLDLPLEEREELLPLCQQHGIALLAQAAPASEARLARIAVAAEGLLALVPGPDAAVTIAERAGEMAALAQLLHRYTGTPCIVDVGDVTPEEAVMLSAGADGVLLSIPLITLIEQHGGDAPGAIERYVRQVKGAGAARRG